LYDEVRKITGTIVEDQPSYKTIQAIRTFLKESKITLPLT
jgi:hypothetical protein